MQGRMESRFRLGHFEVENGNYDRALRHLLISAKMGHKNSVEAIKGGLGGGFATKEQYADALKGY